MRFYRRSLNAEPGLKLWVMTFVFLAFCGASFTMLTIWDFTEQYVKGNIVTYIDTIKGSALYHDELQLSTSDVTLPADSSIHPVAKMIIFVWENPVHFVYAASMKLFYLLSGTRPYYSGFHNLYSMVWHTLVYLMLYHGLKSIENNSAIKYFISTVILLNCLLVSVSSVDWDNRFYLPMQPAIVLASSGAFVAFKKYYRKKRLWK